jgi:hypothetical protein
MSDAEIQAPFLASAVLCEKVLEEKDGTMTVVRIINRLYLMVARTNERGQESEPHDQPSPGDLGFPLPLTAFISFRAIEPTGSHDLRVVAHSPTGKIHEMGTYRSAVQFKQSNQMFNLVLRLGLQAREEGLYWFDVLLDDRTVTRMPLQIVFGHPPPTSSTSESPSQSQANPAPQTS